MNVVPRAKGLLKNNKGLFLVLRRADGGGYDLPGGKIIIPNSPEKTFFREVFEETSIVLQGAKCVFGTSYYWGDDRNEYCPFFLFLVNIKKKDIELSSEHSAYKRVNEEFLMSDQMVLWLKTVLLEYFRV